MDGHVRSRCENPADPRLQYPPASRAPPRSPPAGRHGSTKSSTTAIGSLPDETAGASGYTLAGVTTWSGKYLRIVEALRSLQVRSIIVDGEVVWAREDRKSDFDKLHSRAHDQQVFLYAFDLLELNGEDYRNHPLEKRKAKLEKLLARTR
jgi:ATP dependent DNA ligase domain